MFAVSKLVRAVFPNQAAFLLDVILLLVSFEGGSPSLHTYSVLLRAAKDRSFDIDFAWAEQSKQKLPGRHKVMKRTLNWPEFTSSKVMKQAKVMRET